MRKATLECSGMWFLMEQLLHNYIFTSQIAWDIRVPKKYSFIWNSNLIGYSLPLSARPGNSPCECLNGTYHVLILCLWPHLLISSFIGPTQRCHPRSFSWDSPWVHQVLFWVQWLLMLPQIFIFDTINHMFTSAMDISWVHCASMCVFKRTSLPCRITPFPEHSETSSWFMVIQVPPCLHLLAPMVSFSHEVRRCHVRQIMTSGPGSPQYQPCFDVYK